MRRTTPEVKLARKIGRAMKVADIVGMAHELGITLENTVNPASAALELVVACVSPDQHGVNKLGRLEELADEKLGITSGDSRT